MSTFYETPLRSEELYHFGVPGMKWGVRNKQSSSGGDRKRLKLEAKANKLQSKSDKYHRRKVFFNDDVAFRKQKKALKAKDKLEKYDKKKKAGKTAASNVLKKHHDTAVRQAMHDQFLFQETVRQNTLENTIRISALGF